MATDTQAGSVEDGWQTNTGLGRDEFEKFTRYCNQSDNAVDNCNRARILGFTAPNVKVAPGAIVRLRPGLQPGENSFIGLYTYVNGAVTIGRNVLIGPHCSIVAGNHKYDPQTGWFSARTEGDYDNSIVIGDGAWLATGCTVTAGVRLGRCCLVCANSVVTKDTPDHAIMAGTPARQIGRIDPETGEYLWFGKGAAS